MNLLDIVYGLAAAATAPWWMRKKRSGWADRFARGIPALPPRRPGRARVMVHAVSVGEVNALRNLVPRLSDEAEVVVSSTTDTGIARARELFAESATVVRFPLDASWSVRRFLDAVRPDVVALVELELWPNFIRACGTRAIPVAVINGRLSERSSRGYRKLRRWLSPTFRALAVAAVQDETYAARFADMGVPAERCVITGSMKYDSTPIEDKVQGARELASELGIDPAVPLVVAGSTGPGEEELLVGSLRAELDAGRMQLLCAPRKPERFDAAAEAMPGCTRRTAAERGSGLFLLDTIGELRMAYALATVVVVGRSFFDQHGSDPIEPIALGKPVVIGPAVSDFAAIVRRLDEAGALCMSDRESLADDIRELLADPERRESLASRGQTCVRTMQGASERHAELLLHLASGGSGVERRAGESESGEPADAAGLGSSAARA